MFTLSQRSEVNPIAIIQGAAAAVTILVAMPLVRRRVKRDAWYGVRIPEAFKSESRWYEINEYGGRVLIYWAALIAMTSAAGLFIERPQWNHYAWVSTGVTLGGLPVAVAAIYLYAAKSRISEESGSTPECNHSIEPPRPGITHDCHLP